MKRIAILAAANLAPPCPSINADVNKRIRDVEREVSEARVAA
jgi:hypothetical protein